MASQADGQKNTGGSPFATLAAVTVATGVIAGVGGMVLSILLHEIQHIAFGYDIYHLHGARDFLQGVSASSPARRIIVLGICGLLAGVGWWLVRRHCAPLVPSKLAAASPAPRMPLLATIWDSLLQIVTVALGSPLGREGAPREMAAVFAGRLANAARLTVGETQVIIAAAAGAGLAAVYNVPLGGMCFTLEVLLCTLRFSALLPALAASGIASMIAWIGLGDVAPYVFPEQAISPSLVAWSVVCGPLFGCAAYGFVRCATAMRAQAATGWRLIPLCLAQFLLLGLAATVFPELLGNGKGPLQMSLYNELSTALALTLFLLKFAFIAASLRVGAAGGLLTPGMALGAMLATATASLWNMAFPAVEPASLAIIGAGAFLASSMNMPLTAIVLSFEFTHFTHDFFYPLIFAVAGSVATFKLLSRQAEPGR